MKNLLFVSVALSVFTVTSFSASAQFKRNLLIDLNLLNDVVEYGKIKSSSKFTTSLKKILAPVLMATELCSTIQFKYAQLLNKNFNDTITISQKLAGLKLQNVGRLPVDIDISSFLTLD